MNQENFVAAIQALKELAKAYENVLAMEDIKEEIKDLNLSKQQLDAVCDYLLTQKIEIADYKPQEQKKEIQTEVNEEDAKFLQMYLEEIKDLPDLTKPEVTKLFEQAVSGDEQARESLVAGYLKRIVDIARLYKNQGVFLEDLIQEGNMGMLLGIATANTRSSIEDVEQYLMEQITQAMEGAICEADADGEQEEELVKQMEEVDRYITIFEQENKRKPTADELAEMLNIPVEQVKAIMGLVKSI